jgi:ferredoxin/flavodoxin
MIFYFSGTGNSLYVAKKIAEQMQDEVVQISENSMKENMTYSILENERVGFVFPVYWYGIPTIVEKYIENLILEGYNNQYVYTVATYGLSAGNTVEDLSKLLNKKKLILSGKFGVKMVDNYVVGYNLVDEAKQKEILEAADIEINKISDIIKDRGNKEYIKKGLISWTTPIVHSFYKKANHTKKFYTTHSCNGCGLCAKNCPCNVITIEEQKPKWDGDCTHCLKCINQCPKSAIQYGKGTRKRRRYYNNY